MKKINIYKILLLFLSGVITAQTDSQSLFSQGNNDFMQGQFALARQSYEKIEPKNSVIWQNIGNCFFNEKKYQWALVSWKRAQIGATWKQLGQLFSSERMALAALHILVDAEWKYEIKKIIMSIPTLAWQIILLILLCYVLVVSSGYWYISKFLSRKKQKTWLVLFCIVLCCMIWYAQSLIFKKGKAIIVKEKVIVFAGPEKTFHSKGQLPLGSQIDVLGSTQDMNKIAYLTENGKKERGWIISDSLELI